MTRRILGLSFLFACTVLCNVAFTGETHYLLSVDSDRESYIEGMSATFTVKLTDDKARAVNMTGKYLFATFPADGTEIQLTAVDSTTWAYSVVTGAAGVKVLHVELRQDARAQVNTRSEKIAEYQATIDELTARIAELQELLANSQNAKEIKKLEKDIKHCESQIAINEHLIEVNEATIEQLERDSAAAEEQITVLAKPVPVVTSPADGSFARATVSVAVNLDWANGATVTFQVDGVAKEDKTVTTATTTFELDTTALADGNHTVAARIAPTGYPTTYDSTAITLVVDNTVPGIAPLAPADSAILRTATPTICATLSDNLSGIDTNTAVLKVDGSAVTATVTPTGISYTPQQALADGVHTASIAVQDKAGNASQVSWSFTTDITPPAAAVSSPADGAVLNNATPAIAATFSDNLTGIDTASVVLKVNNSTVAAAVTAEGVIYTPQTAFTDGTQSVSLSVADKAGNATQIGWSFVTDVTAPVIADASPANGAVLKTATPTISAAFSDNLSGIETGSVVLSVDGVVVQSTVTAEGATYTPQNPLADGAHTIVLAVSDKAGNAAQSTWSFATDTVAPVISNRSPVGLLANATPTISADYTDATSGIDQNAVVIKLDNADVTAAATVTGAGIAFVPAADLSEGAHSVSITVSDIAGNSATETFTFTVDTIAPAITSILPQDESITNNLRPAFTILAADATSGVSPDDFSLQVAGQDVSAAVVATEEPAGYRFTYTPTADLPEGVISIALACSDIAGNEQVSATSFTIDVTPPAVPGLYGATSPVVTEDDHAIVQVSTSSEATTLEVLCPTATVVSVNQTGTENELSIWSISLIDLDDGDNAVTATATDAAGNVSAAGSFTVQVGMADTEPPIVLTIEPATGSSFDTRNITVFGTAMNHEYKKTTVRVFRIGGNTGTTGTLVSSTSSEEKAVVSGPDAEGRYVWDWSVSNVCLGRGLNRVEIIAEDESGNISVKEEVYYTLNTFLAADGAEAVQPLDSASTFYSFWVRDPEDVVSHNIKGVVRVVEDYGEWGYYEYEWAPLNSSSNIGTATFIDAYMYYNYPPYMYVEGAYIQYSVTYREPGGGTSTYTKVYPKELAPPSSGNDLPCKIVISPSKDGKGMVAKVKPKTGYTNDDFKVGGEAELKGTKTTVSKELASAILEQDTWTTSEVEFSVDIMGRDVGGAATFEFQGEFYALKRCQFLVQIVDTNGMIKNIASEYFDLPGHDNYSHDTTIPLNVTISAGGDDGRTLYFELDPSKNGTAPNLNGKMPRNPTLGKTLTYYYGYFGGVNTSVSSHTYLNGIQPPRVTTLQLVDGAGGISYNNNYDPCRPTPPYRKDGGSQGIIMQDGESQFVINSPVSWGKYQGRYMASASGWDTVTTDCNIVIMKSNGAWIAFGLYPDTGWAVKKGSNLPLRLWRFAANPNHFPAGTVSFSRPSAQEGEEIYANAWNVSYPNHFQLETAEFSPGAVTVTATVDGAAALNPNTGEEMNTFGTLTASQTVEVFTHEIRATAPAVGNEPAIDTTGTSITVTEGRQVTFTATVQGTDTFDHQWYIDAANFSSSYDRTKEPCIVIGATGSSLTHSFYLPVQEDPWYPGWFYKPGSGGCHVRHTFRRKIADDRIQEFSEQIYIDLRPGTAAADDIVISDSLTGGPEKIVHYALPSNMREARLELYTRENGDGPTIHRNINRFAPKTAGLHLNTEISDFFGEPIGGHCWASLRTRFDVSYRTTTDQSWMVQGAKEDESLEDLHRDGRQYAVLQVTKKKPIHYSFLGKAPIDATVTYQLSDGGIGSKIAPYDETLGGFSENHGGLTIANPINPIVPNPADPVNHPFLFIAGKTAGTAEIRPYQTMVHLYQYSQYGSGDPAYVDVEKTKWFNVYLTDMDADSDNNGAIGSADEDVEDESPGMIVQENDDNDDAADEPEDEKEIDKDNDRIDGDDDLEDMKLVVLRALPEKTPDGEVRLSQSGEGKIRLFMMNKTCVLSPDNTTQANVWHDDIKKGTTSFWVEGVEPGELVLKAEFFPNSGGGSFVVDEVTITVVDIDFVIPDEAYKNGEDPKAGRVETEFVGVSDPKPTVTIGKASSDVSSTSATVVLKDIVVRDPIADNIPRSAGTVADDGADIEHLKVFVGGEEKTELQTNVSHQEVTAEKGFWKQHPYKGTVDSITVALPLEETTHYIKVQTSENAAGNIGFDEVAVTLQKREIPLPAAGAGGDADTAASPMETILNLYIPADSATVADKAYYYRGDRAPTLLPAENPDVELDETDVATHVYTGTINNLTTTVTLTDFAGLTPAVDSAQASISYSLSGVSKTIAVTLTETGAETNIFRTTWTDTTPEDMTLSLYAPADFTAAPDSLQIATGPHGLLVDDTVATEGETALLFSADLADGTKMAVSVSQVWQRTDPADPATLAWVTPAGGVVSWQSNEIEQLKASVTYTFADGAVMSFAGLELMETAADSRVFRAGVGVEVVSAEPLPGQPPAPVAIVKWAAKVDAKEGSTKGSYIPLTVKVKGLPNPEDFSVEWMDEESHYDLEKHNNEWYLKGASVLIAVVVPDPDDPNKLRIIYYTVDENGKLKELKKFLTVFKTKNIWLKDKETQEKRLAEKGVTFFKVDFDIIKQDETEMGEKEEDTTGEVVPVNIDDDDKDGGTGADGQPTVISDKDDTDGVIDEDDLVALKLHKFEGKHLQHPEFKLVFSAERISLWKTKTKTGVITSDTTRFDATKDHTVYVEGKKPSLSNGGEVITMTLNSGDVVCSSDAVKVIVPEMIFAIFGDGAVGEANLRSYLNSEKKDSRTNPYIIQTQKKCFSVTIWNSERDAKLALGAEGAYVAYDGHSNEGLGFAFSTGLKSISEFMNCSDALVAIDWPYLRRAHPQFMVQDSEYGDDVTTTPPPDESRFDPIEYPALYYGLNKEADHTYTTSRYSNKPVELGVRLHLTRGTNKWEDYHTDYTEGKRIIVKSGSKDMPEKRWKKMFLNSCRSGDHYGFVFNHGTLFFTKESCEDDLSTKLFVKGIVEDKTDDEILSKMNMFERVYDYHKF